MPSIVSGQSNLVCKSNDTLGKLDWDTVQHSYKKVNST